jgi:hypothetical protein
MVEADIPDNDLLQEIRDLLQAILDELNDLKEIAAGRGPTAAGG